MQSRLSTISIATYVRLIVSIVGGNNVFSDRQISTGSLNRVALIAIAAFALAGCPEILGPILSAGWTYNLEGRQFGHRVAGLTSGDVIVVGVATSDEASDGVAFLRVSDSGELLASKLIPSLTAAVAEGHAGPSLAARVLSNGDSVIAGTTPELLGSSLVERMRIIRLGEAGQTIWDTVFGDEELMPRAIAESEHGDILIAGNRLSSTGQHVELFLLLLQPNGQVADYKLVPRDETYPTTARWSDVKWNTDGNYYLTGDGGVDVNGNFSPHVAMVQINPALEILRWDRLVPGQASSPAAIDVEEDAITTIARAATGNERPILVNVDKTGSTLLTRDDIFVPSGSSERGKVYDFIVDSSGDIVMVGEGTTVNYAGGFFPQITRRAFIAKVTAEGEQVWKTNIDVPGTKVYGVTETADGGYATCGAADGNDDVLLNVIFFNRNGKIVN